MAINQKVKRINDRNKRRRRDLEGIEHNRAHHSGFRIQMHKGFVSQTPSVIKRFGH